MAANASCTVVVGFKPTAAGARSGTLTIANNGSGSPITVALSGTGVALSPVAQVSPTSLSFASTLNTATAAQTVTVSNTGNAVLNLSALSLSGASAADFAISSSGPTCATGGAVAAGGSCAVKIVFTPSAVGARAATLTVAHNASGSPSTVSLNGTGTDLPKGTLTLNQNTLTFASTAVGGSSQQSVTLGNNGQAALTLSGLSVGGANASEFAVGGNCAVGGSLAMGASCTATVTFTPTATGTRSGTLTVASTNSTNPSATLTLSGPATQALAPAVSVSAGTVDLGSVTVNSTSAVKTVTVQNSGTAALAISSIAASPSGFATTSTCGSSLAAGASCTVSVSYTAAATGAAAGTLTITTNAASSPTKVALTATGVDAAKPVLSWTPATTALSFADTNVGAVSATQTVTLTNAGPGAVTLAQVQKGGANANDFSILASNCTSGATLAVGASCKIGVAFQPSNAGDRSATLSVSSNGSGPSALTLSGKGVSVAAPAFTVAPAAINLTAAKSGYFLVPQVLTLTNSGTGSLRVLGILPTPRIWVLNYSNTEGGTCPRGSFTLEAGKSCSVKVTGLAGYVPANSKVLISTSASTTPVSVPVTGPARVVVGCTALDKLLGRRCDHDD